MRIYKNNSYVKLELDEFLGLLEEDALDEIIYMVTDLDATGSINEGYDNFLDDYTGDIEDILMGDYPAVVYYQEGIDVSDLMEMFPDDTEFYPVSEDDEEALMSMMYDFPGYEDGMIAGESLMDNLLLSNEDLRVKKIVKRFSHLLDD